MFAILDSTIILAIFFIAVLGTLSSLAANEKGVYSTVLLIGFLAVLQFFTTLQPFTFAYLHPLLSLGIVAAYLFAGVVYLYVRWRWFFIKNAKASYDAYMAITGNSKSGFVGNAGYKVGIKSFPIKVSDYKEMLYCWNFYWPLLIAHSVLKDPLRLFRERIGKTLQNVADSAFQQ